jgi:hypothetical protein
MSATSENPQKTARHSTGPAVAIAMVAATLALIVAFAILAGPADSSGQDACIAAHVAERGINRHQLTTDVHYQSDLVAILSSCTGMAP